MGRPYHLAHPCANIRRQRKQSDRSNIDSCYGLFLFYLYRLLGSSSSPTDKLAPPTLTPSNQPIRTISTHTQTIRAVQWNHNNSVLVTSGDDSSIILSGVADGKTILRLPAANSTNALSSPTSSPSASHVTSLAFSAGSRYLVAGGGSSSLRVFDLKHPDRTPRRLAGHVAEVLALDFGAQDATVASCSEAGEILIHSLAQSSLQTKLASDGLPLYDIQHSPHRNGVLAAVGEGGHVQVWDILTSTLSSTLKPGLTLGPGPLSALRFSTTSANLLAAVGGKRLCFFDVASKKCIRDIATDYPLTSLDYHSDGCSIAIGTAVGHILMYDIRAASKPTAKILNAHRGEVNAIKFEHTLTGKKATTAPSTSTAASESSRPRADQSSAPLTTSSQALPSSSPPSISSSALTTIPATSSTVPSSALSRTNVSMNSSNLSSFSNATAPAGVTSTPFHNLFPSHLPPPGISDAFSPLKSHPSSTSYGSASPFGNVTSTSSDSSTSTSNMRSSHMPPAHLTATFGTKLTTSSLQPTQSSTSSSSMTSHGFNLSNVLPPSSSSTLSPSTTLPSSPRSNFPTASSTTATLARSPSPSSSSSPMPASTKQLIPSPDRRSHRSNLADGFSNMSDNNFGTPSSPSSSSGVGGGFTNSSHGLNDYQVSLLKSMLDESLYSLRTEFRSHLNDMHMQMIKQFHLQQLEHQRQMDAMTAKLNETLAKLAAPRPFPFQDFY